MVATSSSTSSLQDQQKILHESLEIVKVQAYHMKKYLEANKLMDALKHCSTMLSELRTATLTPKSYYELYMAIFDELRYLNTYLYDAHMSHRHHLSDLYELVQYAGSIVPRLYLMITVGSVYMRVSKELIPQSPIAADEAVATVPVQPSADEDQLESEPLSPDGNGASEYHTTRKAEVDEVPPAKELMKDMLEMSRGVQHPTRGLFLRYYLSQMTRDFLPDGLKDGPHGTIHDSVQFILQNFIEMNKLWVRLQHQGHSREREKREMERRELRQLVGNNLVRLSQLESLDLEMYNSLVLPSILEEIVSCRDVIAQEYLMEVIIQVFHDDFHLRSLGPFLAATRQLQRSVNVKQIVITLIDRFANYAARARDEAEARAKDEELQSEERANSGIPEDVALFDVFWAQITELVEARTELSIQDVSDLLVSLCNLALNCYPERLDYVDKVLGYCKERLLEAQKNGALDLRHSKTVSSLLQLLLAPIHAYNSDILIMLQFPSSVRQSNGTISQSLAGNYADLLYLQPYSTRRQIAHAVAGTALRSFTNSDFIIDSVDGVNALFGELCSIMIREQKDGGLFGPKPEPPVEEPGPKYLPRAGVEELPLDWEDVLDEQNMVAKMVHLIKTRDADADKEFLLFSTTKGHFGEGGDIRIRFTLPPLVVASVRLARKFKNKAEDTAITQKLSQLFQFIHHTIDWMSKAREYFADEDGGSLFRDDDPVPSNGSKLGHGLMAPPDISLRLSLMAAQSADEAGFEDLAYEFFVQAFTMYEESISESKAQFAAISLMVGTLYGTTVFGYENYETLICKCRGYCARLLKRVDQCRGLTLVSHLFWGDDTREREEGKNVYRNGQEVLDTLNRALRIAESVMDRGVKAELLVGILERYVWYFEKRNDAITVKYLNQLIDDIQTNISLLEADRGAQGVAAYAPGPLSPAGSTLSLFDDPAANKKISETVLKHFRNVMAYVKAKKEEEAGAEHGYMGVAMEGGFEQEGRTWKDIEVGGR